jgi:exodeoxyribonuclease VIII
MADTHEIPAGEASGMRRAGEGARALFPERPDGIVRDMPFADYLATDAVSKSTLWTAVTRSPAHARIEKEQSNAMLLGAAVHCALLTPDAFESAFTRGPPDRRGNRWKEALDEHGDGLLTAGDYDDALAIRDSLSRDPMMRKILKGAVTEVSGFWTDAETGLRCRCRPDVWNPAMGLLADLKVTNDARPHAFRRRVADFGYHAQEAFYTDGWRACGADVAAFVFIAVEPSPPFGFVLYELDPAAAEQGRTAMRLAMEKWRSCTEQNDWPAYARGVTPLDLPQWAYRDTGEGASA